MSSRRTVRWLGTRLRDGAGGLTIINGIRLPFSTTSPARAPVRSRWSARSPGWRGRSPQPGELRQPGEGAARTHQLLLDVHERAEHRAGPARPGDEEEEAAERVAVGDDVPGAGQPGDDVGQFEDEVALEPVAEH